jgi:hypothetical protein
MESPASHTCSMQRYQVYTWTMPRQATLFGCCDTLSGLSPAHSSSTGQSPIVSVCLCPLTPATSHRVGLVCRGNPQKVKELMVVDILLLVFGTLATQSRGLLSWVLFGLASACLLQTFRSLWTMTRRAIQLDRRGVVPLNARAINLVCWEIVLSWSLFPVAEGLKQAGILSFEASEACLCVADYASKVRICSV